MGRRDMKIFVGSSFFSFIYGVRTLSIEVQLFAADGPSLA